MSTLSRHDFAAAAIMAAAALFFSCQCTGGSLPYKIGEELPIGEVSEDPYHWTVTDSIRINGGLTYKAYDIKGKTLKMKVLEVNLMSDEIEVITAIADDIVPNPNGNGNSNNGFKIRELLSQICARKRAEGHDILAGINTGFFDSNDGFPRGFHVEEGEPVFIINPYVVTKLPNHDWAFTIFYDGTASCCKKYFSGKIQLNGKEYEYYSVNDTILRHSSPDYPINLYTSRYKKEPHPGFTNPLSNESTYIIAEYTREPMKVNSGYFDATVKSISNTPEYLNNALQIGIAISPSYSEEIKRRVKLGDIVRLRADIMIENGYKPIRTLNSTMFQFMVDGKESFEDVPETNQSKAKLDPLTFPVVSRDRHTVWFVEIDGRQPGYSEGVNCYDMFEIAKRLGGYNMTRFDGGGSSAMWLYSDGEGKIISSPSDSGGERSCMNYILIRSKK